MIPFFFCQVNCTVFKQPPFKRDQPYDLLFVYFQSKSLLGFEHLLKVNRNTLDLSPTSSLPLHAVCKNVPSQHLISQKCKRCRVPLLYHIQNRDKFYKILPYQIQMVQARKLISCCQFSVSCERKKAQPVSPALGMISETWMQSRQQSPWLQVKAAARHCLCQLC